MCTNADFSESLFGEVKKHKVNEKIIKSRDICLIIKRNNIPELPASKVGKKPMRLAWHMKGMCNLACPHAADHANYTNDEHSAQVRWCRVHYPKDNRGGEGECHQC